MKKFAEFCVAAGRTGVYLVTSSVVSASVSLWQLLSGNAIPGRIAFVIANGFLLATGYVAWKRENGLKLNAQQAFEWERLAERFRPLTDQIDQHRINLVSAQFERDQNSGARTWRLPTNANNRNVQLCSEICRIAGKCLKISRYIASHFPALLITEDDIDRWLNAIVDVTEAGIPRGITTVQIQDQVANFEHGEIRNLAEASVLLCLRLASEDLNFHN